jgi:DNA mismatch endonuclease (patch repair protein)
MAEKRKGVPAASSPEALHRMQSTRRRDTAAEVALRKVLHRLGLRYRIDRKPLPDLRRKADVLFRKAKVAVYVDGCFWHGCPLHATWPRQNARFWRDKIETNRRRDADTDHHLLAAGWAPLRVWEHEEPQEAARRIALVVRARLRGP